MMTVPLRGKRAAGRVALVDDGDYELVMAYKWHLRQNRAGHGRWSVYARADIKRPGERRVVIYMHKLITGWPETDHVNHNGLDNRRVNLRPATQSQNNANQRPQEGRTSRFKGVHWDRSRQKWQAKIQASGHIQNLGRFLIEEDAARAYDAAALAAWGEYAYLNFVPGAEPGS